MIFPYLYDDMSFKRLVILSILSVSALVAYASATNDTIAASDTIRFDDGAWYCGQISDSLFNGYGKMFYADSTIYQGEWKDGLWNGNGVVFFPDGDYYEGAFKEHKFSGYGTYIYADSSRYEGYWKNGMFNGAGTFYYSNGDIYSGEWMDDRKHGTGILYIASDNNLIKGRFIQDMYVPLQNEIEPAPQIEYLDDGKVHYQGLTTVSVSYGLKQFLSVYADFHTSDLFFAGFSIGFNTATRRIGEPSVVVNDETESKETLVDWDSFPDEIVTEHTYDFFRLMGECGLSRGWFSMGTAVGVSLRNTVRNCRSLSHNDSYFEPGTLYYREKLTGAKFAYDIFTDIVLNRPNAIVYSISLRTGYSNIAGFHMGAGITF